MRLLGAIILAGLCFLSARAEDWTTTDGKTYQDVKIIKVEDDAVTILYRDGGARVRLNLLPVDLQTRFNYDPAKAKIAAAKHDAEEKEADAQFAREVEPQNAQQQQEAQNAIDHLNSLSGDPAISGAPTPDSTTTELGRYEAKVYLAVGSRWYPKVDKMMQLVTNGEIKIQYTIYYDGSVQVKVLAGGNQPLLLAICRNAITEAAPFPPFTDSMRKQAGDSFTDYFTFTVKDPIERPQSGVSH